MDYIKLYAVEYIYEEDADNFNPNGSMEVFLRESEAREFADTIDEALVSDIFTADFNREFVYIEDGKLNYEDCSELMDWDSRRSIKSN